MPPKEKKASALSVEFSRYFSLTEIFPLHGPGLETGRDAFAVDFEDKPLLVRVEVFRRSTLPPAEAAKKLGIDASGGWDAGAARAALQGAPDRAGFIQPLAYRVCDSRSVFYHDAFVDRPETTVLKHMDAGKNRALVASPGRPGEPYAHFWVCDRLVNAGFLTGNPVDGALVFPVDRLASYGNLSLGKERNLGYDFLRALVKIMGVKCRYPDGMPKGADPDDIFNYIYAILNSPGYRARYARELERGFPRVPIVSDLKKFNELRDLGRKLSDLHLLRETPERGAALSGEGSGGVDRDPVFEAGEVRINHAQSFGPVPREAWEFRVAGVPVLHAWLAARRDRRLTIYEISSFGRIVHALAGTLAVQSDIDAAIERQGGWPIQ